jgi:Zn-dependent peptidase ImmA (M78 family)
METQTKPYSKEEVKEILSQIDEKLNDYLKSGRYKDVLMMMGNLGNYSLTNQIYILLQNPEATHVAGMKGWNYLGRSVKKGEKALRIFAPIKGKKTDELTDGEGHAVLDENGNKITRTYDIVKGFKPSYVWDISQTSGREIKPLKFGEMPSKEEHDIIMKGLTDTVKTIGFQVEYATKETLGEGCYGLCNHMEKKILLLEGMNPTQEVSTLAHECGHAFAHNPYKRDFSGLTSSERREIKEVEAESISCTLCTYLGLDTTDFNFAYIATWADGDLTKFRKNMDVISEYANKLIEGVDNAFIQDKKMKASLVKQAKSENIQVPPTKQQHCEMEAC